MASAGEVGTAKGHVSDGEYTCGECNKGDRTTKATHYCPECDQCYCKVCLCDHDVIGRSGIHRWGNRSASTKKGSQDVEMCVRHPGYELQLYCVDHDDICCRICRTTSHRTCLNLKQIKDAADEAEIEAEIKHVNAEIEGLNLQLAWVNYDSKFKEQNAGLSHAQYIEQLHRIREEINEIFDNIENGANARLQDLTEKFKTDRHFCDEQQKFLSGIQQMLQIDNDKEILFVQVKRRRTLVRERMTTISQLREADVREMITPIPGYAVDMAIQCIESMKPLHMSISHMPYTKKEVEIDFEIGAMCQIKNGDFIVADASNKKLIQLHDSVAVVRTYKFDQSPTDVCYSSSNEVAVLMKNKTVKFVSVMPCLEITESTDLDREHSHFTIQDNQIYSAHKSPCNMFNRRCTCQIVITCYSRQGEVVWTNRLEDNCHTSDSRSLPLRGHLHTLFIASHSGSMFTCDQKGSKLASISLGGNLTDVYVNDLGVVYVGDDRHTIYTVEKWESGEKKIISTKDLGIPSHRVLCLDNRNGRLIVSCQQKMMLHWV